LRLFDEDYNSTTPGYFAKLRNPFWLVIVTMTTVGYGDYAPRSILTKIIGVIMAFYGVFIVSLFVIALS